MKSSRNLYWLFCSLIVFLAVLPIQAESPALSPVEQLGRHLFYDANLSTPSGMACAVCHGAAVGFTGPDEAINKAGAVYRAVIPDRAGNRKPPASAYAGDSPKLHFDKAKQTWRGGMFWDGRATGRTLGDPLAEQAQGPFLNPLEQNTPSAREMVLRVAKSSYAPLFKTVWGPNSLDAEKDVAGSYARIGRSIAAYERSTEMSPFSSKYDAFLAGRATLTAEEDRGRRLFNGKAKCSTCHTSTPGPNDAKPIFTNFTYENLGVPKNPDNPFYHMPAKWNPEGKNWIDTGLGGFLKSKGYAAKVYEPQMGKFKVPTLRNVGKRPNPAFVKAYGHNGHFKSLAAVVHFYNTRDIGSWPAPEYPKNINRDDIGNLGLTAEDEAALVAFLRTLTDGYTGESHGR